MGKAFISLLVLSLVLAGLNCYSQTRVKVSDPRMELKNRKLHISYDILNSDLSDHFTTTIEITDAEGNAIIPKRISGDIGLNVPGGKNKLIIWDIEADQIKMTGDIFVAVAAEATPEEDAKTVQQEDRSSEMDGSTAFNRNGIIARSIIFPGWGLTKMTGGPHWLKGVAGYGCIAGSIVLNQMAKSTYEDFKISDSIEGANSLLDESSRQDNTSELLAYAAIGIWITDLIWTVVKTSGHKEKSFSTHIHGNYADPDLNPYVPLFGIAYNF